ncbi:hypothetical protein [Acidipropionibacterium acidipropionici]|uniref:hypothetical protein n=1 Tax=Acidipropionibacterium acidipropionici TaxID=1748 RepID=UPI00110BBD53|nr:hypothetical protein [Acidipropionibacterium acidipropionici]QCV95727.1 hypothetical protein FEZ30_11105 [Acidipropionibacterium acidipropionici]
MGETELGAAGQLLSAVRDLAASVGEPGIGRAERVTRSRRAAEAARDVPVALGKLDPYADGRHNRVSDMMLVAAGPVVRNDAGVVGREGGAAAESSAGRAAADRLMAARELAGVRAQTRAAGIGFANLGESLVSPVSTETPGLAAWLEQFAVPAEGSVAMKKVTPLHWDKIPAGTVDPGLSNPAGGGTQVTRLLGDERRYTMGSWATSRSTQAKDWAPGAEAELDRFGDAVASVCLEAELIRQLADGAPAASDFAAAEVAAGAAWPTGADLVLCNAADRPKIVRAYAAEQLAPEDRPQVLATGGVREAGMAYVLAMGGVWLEAAPTEVFSALDPENNAVELGWLRYGLVAARAAGVMQKVEVA